MRAGAVRALAVGLIVAAYGCTELPVGAPEQVRVELRVTDWKGDVGDTLRAEVEAYMPNGSRLLDPPVYWLDVRTPDWMLPVGRQDTHSLWVHAARPGRYTADVAVGAAHPFFISDTVSVATDVIHHLTDFEIVGVGRDTTFHSLDQLVELPVIATDHRGRLLDVGNRLAGETRRTGVVSLYAWTGAAGLRTRSDGVDTVTLWFNAPCRGRCADTLVVRVDQQPTDLRERWTLRRWTGGTSRGSGDRRAVATSLGDTVRIAATVHDANGVQVPGVPVIISVPDPADTSVIRLDNADSGVVVAVGNGLAEVVLSAAGLSDTVHVGVRQRVGRLQVEFPADTLPLGSVDTMRVLLVTDGRQNTFPADWVIDYEWSTMGRGVLLVEGSGPMATIKAVSPGSDVPMVSVLACAPDDPCLYTRREVGKTVTVPE